MEFEEIYQKLKETLSKGDKETNQALIIFSNSLQQSSHNELVSWFQSFSGILINRYKNKIKFNLAVTRRKSKIGSRQKQNNSKFKVFNNLPHKTCDVTIYQK